MKFYLTLFFLFFSISTIAGQTNNANYLSSHYYSNIYKADSLFMEKKYEAAYNLLNDTFAKFTPIQIKGYNEYTTYTKIAYLLGKQEKYIEGVENLIQMHGYTKEQIESDDVLSQIFELKSDLNIEGLRAIFLSNSNIELQNELINMKNLDQLFRNSKTNYDANIKKQDSIDKKIGKTMILIFESIGFPSAEKIGLNSSYASLDYDITSILLHASDSLKINYFLPRLNICIKDGLFDPIIYARVYDRYLIDNNQEQLYYTYKEKDVVLTKNDILDINNRRSKIGLPSLRSEIWRLSKKYGPDSVIVERMKYMLN